MPVQDSLNDLLDAPTASPEVQQDLFKSLLLQIPLFFFILIAHLLYWDPSVVALGGTGLLLLVEMATSRPLRHSPFPWLRPIGVLLGLFLLLNVGFYFSESVFFFNKALDLQTPLFCILMAYQVLWCIQPNTATGSRQPPFLRLVMGGTFVALYVLFWGFSTKKLWAVFFHFYFFLLLLFVVLAILIIPKLVREERRAWWIDDITWLRFPQLGCLLLIMVVLYSYHSAALSPL